MRLHTPPSLRARIAVPSFVLVLGLNLFAGPTVAADVEPALDLDLLRAATVLVSDEYPDPREGSWGTGSIVGEDGLILTNAHVVANRAQGLAMLYPEVRYEEPSPARFFIYVAGEHGRDDVVPAYRAKVAAVDGYRDLAVLQIYAWADGGLLDPADLSLTPIPLGSSKDLEPLDRLVVAGFPGIANSLAVRFTEGQLNNFARDPWVGSRAWLHADVKTAPGNSGGPVVDATGRQVGVATASTTTDNGSATDYMLRPIDLAIPLLKTARTHAPYEARRVVSSTGDASARVVGWSDHPEDKCTTNGGATVPHGTWTVYPQLQLDGMRPNNVLLVELLKLDGADDGVEVVAYDATNWRDWWESAVCLSSLALWYDHDVPNGFLSAFPEGEYGIRVWSGPSLDQLISDDVGASTLTIGRAGKAPFTATTASLTDAATPPAQAAERLLAQARLANLARCTRLGSTDRVAPLQFERPALAAIQCRGQSAGVGPVMLAEFTDPVALTRYWVRWIDQVPGRLPSNDARCWNGKKGVSTWEHGSVACFVSTSRNGKRIATVGWTDERTNTYSSVRGSNGNLKALFKWWRNDSP